MNFVDFMMKVAETGTGSYTFSDLPAYERQEGKWNEIRLRVLFLHSLKQEFGVML